MPSGQALRLSFEDWHSSLLQSVLTVSLRRRVRPAGTDGASGRALISFATSRTPNGASGGW